MLGTIRPNAVQGLKHDCISVQKDNSISRSVAEMEFVAKKIFSEQGFDNLDCDALIGKAPMGRGHSNATDSDAVELAG